VTTPIRATYRLQLHAGFTFDDAAAAAKYLADLNVTHAYCSPYLQAAEGSTHGYDVIDHSTLTGNWVAKCWACRPARRLGCPCLPR
jgi:(1->4)-alpha-D-glucan 1-alpha-D-glucosylmutase